MPDNRREFLAKMLALVPASIVGRGFLKSANVARAAHSTARLPTSGIAKDGTNRADGWHLYEQCGQSLFPVYGGSGGLCTSIMAYLVRKHPHPWKITGDGGDMAREIEEGRKWSECIPIEFTDHEFFIADYDFDHVKRHINEKIRYAIKYRKPQPINMDGGNFPRVSFEERQIEAAYFNGRNWSGQQYADRAFQSIDYPENFKLAEHLTGVVPRLYGK